MSDAAMPGFAGDAHVFPVRVYYEDTDAFGIVYHANYLRFAERARTEMMRALGCDRFRLMAEAGIAFAVRRCEAAFRAPARLDDWLQVHTRIHDVRGASLDAEQMIRRDGIELVRMRVNLACVIPSGRPSRIPRELHNALKNLCIGNIRLD